jgi:transposase
MGHQVEIMPPSYVKAYVRRGKTDAADAAAICEAVMRPHMRFVPIKTEDQQAALMLHKARGLCHISGFYLLLLSSRREPGYAIPMP